MIAGYAALDKFAPPRAKSLAAPFGNGSTGPMPVTIIWTFNGVIWARPTNR